VIPDDVYDALELPEEEREAAVRQELAVSLYDRGVLPFGKAQALADLSKVEFHRLLSESEVRLHCIVEASGYKVGHSQDR
jgi:predicted HTH domain antitoxin